MAARDGYLRVANEHPQFDGMSTTVERDAKNVPIKATCCVWRKDRSHPITCEAYYSEYRKSSPVWNQYPSAMISKVAEVLALKRSFSINGVVTEEEIGNQAERGSTEAAQSVAKEKIAKGKKPEVIDAVPVEDTLKQSIEQTDRYKTLIKAFAEMKDEIGEQEYYRILGAHGCEHCNEFNSFDLARTCYREMGARLIEMKQMEAE
jgi:hypothetical protein